LHPILSARIVPLLLIFVLLSGCRFSTPNARASGEAPEFAVADIQGKKLALSDYRGKVVLLDFWATWCTPCLDEIPHFVEMQQKYATQGFQAIGISMDDGPKPVQTFYSEHKLNYPVAIGTAKLADSFGGILGLPVTFVIDRNGRIRKKFVGATDPKAIELEVVQALQLSP